MKNLTIILLAVLLGSPAAFAQKSDKASQQTRTYTRAGNKAYKKGHYDDAEAKYHLALKGDSAYYKAQYNLGNSLYRQKRYEDAAQHFASALQSPMLKGKQKGNAFHNMGNSHLQAGLEQRNNRSGAGAYGSQQADDGGMKHFQQAVDSYKEALKLDPKNKDTKYNLSYAQKMLAQAQQSNGGGGNSQNQQGQGQQKQQQQGQGDQNKDKQQNQGNQGQQNQDNKEQQGQERQRQNPSQQQKEQKKRDAEQLLGAVKNNERNTMKEQQRAKEAKVDSKIEKDW